MRAVRLVIRLHANLARLRVHLLYVHVPPVSIREESASPPHSAEAAAREALTAAKALLDASVIPYTSEISSGYVGSAIVAYARAHHCDAVVMGTRGMGSTEQLPGSIARQVIHLADVPVTFVK